MTQSRIETATFRLVAQCLNQLRQGVPLDRMVVSTKRKDVKVKQSHYKPGQACNGTQEVKVPRFRDNGTG